MPNTVFLTNWVAALRSGEFGQITGQLGTVDHETGEVDGYCCLGVACEVAIRMGHNLQKDREAHALIYDGEEMNPPDSVLALSGLPEWAVEVSTEKLYGEVELYDDETKTVDLAELNDNYGWSFTAIADALEENYL